MPQISGETYFNNFGQTGYEEMADWTPEYYQNIKEANANLQFAGSTIDLMAESLEQWCLNMFIDTMDEEALSRMEAFYYLEENASRSISERRRLLKAAQLGSGRVTRDRIGRIVESYTGIYPDFEFLHTFKIKAGFDEDYTLVARDLTRVLRQQMPAHIAYLLIFTIEMMMDFSDVEDIEIPKIDLQFPIPFWEGILMDGNWILDGSVLLNQARQYQLKPGMNIVFSLTEPTEESGASVSIAIGIENDEEIELPSIKAAMAVENNNEFVFAPNLKFEVEEEPESVGTMEIIVFSRDYWLLDGGTSLNGTGTLNSIYRKEIEE
ncbi:MAG: YmfQ family protein [Lachnospiraceae bacterium]|nr:YmfQ family protein [Lachnospiraceae bacterium]